MIRQCRLKPRCGVWLITVIRLTALTLYTGRAAKLFAKESPAGVIAPGAEADFSVLEADPFTMPEDRIHEMRVKRGFLRGAEVFRRED